jgi:hypothetical protein
LAQAIRDAAEGRQINIGQQQQAAQTQEIDYNDYDPNVAQTMKQVAEMQAELNRVKEFYSEQQQGQIMQQAQQAVNGIREYHQNLTGRQITDDEETMLASAVQENGLNVANPTHLKMAYNLVFQDRLMQGAQQKALDKIVSNNKQGVISRSTGVKPSGNGKPKSYVGMSGDDLANEIAKEYGLI